MRAGRAVGGWLQRAALGDGRGGNLACEAEGYSPPLRSFGSGYRLREFIHHALPDSSRAWWMNSRPHANRSLYPRPGPRRRSVRLGPAAQRAALGGGSGRGGARCGRVGGDDAGAGGEGGEPVHHEQLIAADCACEVCWTILAFVCR